jgi:hypothetical protein
MISPEEQFLMLFARDWEGGSVPISEEYDWDRLYKISELNRVDRLLYRALREGGALGEVPQPIVTKMEESWERAKASAEIMSESLEKFLQEAANQNLDLFVMKGLWVSENIYGDPAIRPGGDIDILVLRKDIPQALEALEEQDIGPYWPNLLDDKFYYRHHLHLMRCSPDLKIWYEIHWALEHPYTLLKIDYEGIFMRGSPGVLLNKPLLEMSVEDLILTLTIHLVKHAIYLPFLYKDPNIIEIILADGMLMYFMDIAAVLKKMENEINWTAICTRADEWGVAESLRAVLEISNRFLGAAVPNEASVLLPTRAYGYFSQSIHRRIAGYQLAKSQGQPEQRLWEFLTVPNAAFILRPIKLVDIWTYLFPDRSNLKRIYGNISFATQVRHLLLSSWRIFRFGIDSVLFGIERYRRLKAQNLETSLSTRLETG